MNLQRHVIVTRNPQFTLGLTRGVVRSTCLDKRIMTCIYHYRVVQSIFTAQKIIRALLIHPSLLLNPRQTLILSPSPYFHLFQNVSVIIWCVAFSGWFLYFLNMYLSFLHVFLRASIVFHFISFSKERHWPTMPPHNLLVLEPARLPAALCSKVRAGYSTWGLVTWTKRCRERATDGWECPAPSTQTHFCQCYRVDGTLQDSGEGSRRWRLNPYSSTSSSLNLGIILYPLDLISVKWVW